MSDTPRTDQALRMIWLAHTSPDNGVRNTFIGKGEALLRDMERELAAKSENSLVSDDPLCAECGWARSAHAPAKCPSVSLGEESHYRSTVFRFPSQDSAPSLGRFHQFGCALLGGGEDCTCHAQDSQR